MAKARRAASEFSRRYGPWALVNGASEGLGAAFAEAAAARGLNVLAVARRSEPLAAFAAALAQRFPVQVEPLAADLGRADDLDRIAARATALEVGLLVHSAAVAPIGEFLDRPLEEHAALIDVNVRAPAVLAHRLGGPMAGRGRGGLVLISSMAALQGTAMVAHYAASKAYQRVLAEGLWSELSPRGVDVIACLAGPTDTPTYRAGRPAGPARFEFPPVLAAGFVAEATLDALGRRPVIVPGAIQRGVALLLSRWMPGTAAIRMVSRSTRRMYRP